LLALTGWVSAVPGVAALVVGALRCSPGYHQTSNGHTDLSPGLPGEPDGHHIDPVNSGI